MKKIYFLLGGCLFILMGLTSAQEVVHVQNGAVLTVQVGATMTLAGGLTLDNGSKLVHNGTITLKQNGASGAADWIDNSNGGYAYGSGTTVFNSSTDQTIRTPNSFGQLTINTSAIQLAANTSANVWLLVNGVVNTNGFTAITSSAGSAAVPANAANPGYSKSWINGTLRRYITPATVDSYDFPIGNDGQRNLVTLANLKASPLTNTSYIDASFSPKPGTDLGLIVTEGGTPFIAVNGAGVWHINPDVEPSGGKYDLLLYFGGFTGLVDNQFASLERPDASSNAGDWMVPAGSSLPTEGTDGRTASSGYARRNSLSAFSQFGIGMSGVALPVTLLSFVADRISRQFVELDWQTATEQHDKGFGIERKLDSASSFSDIGFVGSLAPGGTSASPLTYKFEDANSYAGVSYYRLKQEDLDNRSVYTAIKAVSGSGNSGVIVSLYPNPGHGQFTLRVDGMNSKYGAVITDLLGHTIRRIEATGNTNVSVSGLATGLYVVAIPDVFGPGQGFIQKVLIVP